MKKFFTLLAVFISISTAWAEGTPPAKTTAPESGKQYYIMNKLHYDAGQYYRTQKTGDGSLFINGDSDGSLTVGYDEGSGNYYFTNGDRYLKYNGANTRFDSESIVYWTIDTTTEGIPTGYCQLKPVDSEYWMCFNGNGEWYCNTTLAGGGDYIANSEYWAFVSVDDYEQYLADKNSSSPFGQGGNFYLKNVESGRFLAAGNDWGTRASLMEHAEDVTLTLLDDGTYKLTSLSQGNLGPDLYMDNGGVLPLTFTKVDGTEYYTIKNGETIYGYDGTSSYFNAIPEGANAYWQVLTEADLKATLDAAANVNPVDATFLVKGYNFGRYNRYISSAWVMEAENQNLSGGPDGNRCAESWHSTFLLKQTLSGLPEGVYSMTAQGFYQQDASDEENVPVFYAGNETATFFKASVNDGMNGASAAFGRGEYTISPIYVEVSAEGTLEIGAKLENNKGLWCCFDNFTLTYYGDCTISEAKLGSLIAQINALKTEAESYTTNENVIAAVQAQVTDAIAAADAELANTDATEETLQAAIDGLKTAIATAEKSRKSNEIIKNGIIPTDNIDGWSSTVVAQNFHIDTWCGNADDGSNMNSPFLENHLNANNGVLGDGVITYTLEGIENGWYTVSALMRAFSEAGNEVAGTCNFALNDGEPVDMIATGTVSTKGNSRIYGTCERTVKVEDNKLTLSITITGATYNWIAVRDVTVAYLGTTTPEEGAYLNALAKANETLAKDMSDFAKSALQEIVDANGGLTSEATADEFIAAAEALNAAVATAEKAVKSYEIIKNGIIPTDNLDGWASTVPAEKFQVNTWSGNADDGSNINAPFIENWTYNTNGVLGDGVITYTLEGIDNGNYWVSLSMRAFSEAGNAVEGTCNFALNDGEPVDMIATGTESLFGNTRIYATSQRTAKVEDNKLTLSIAIAGATFNWFAFDDVKIAAIEAVTADPADGSTVKSDLKSIAITFHEATAVAVNAESFDPVAILDANGEYAGTIGRMGSPFTAEGNVATLKNLAMGNEMALFPGAGVYTLEIPAGAFLIGEDATPSKKFYLTYTVEEAAPVVANFTATPENGASVETLEKVTLTFTDYEDVGWNYESCTENIVIKKDGEVYKEGNNDTGLTDQPGAYNEFDILAGLTEAGTYEIIVPDGYFKDNMDMSFPNKGFAGFTLTYTVTGAPVVVEVTADPADGSTVQSDLTAISLTFSGTDALALNAENYDAVAILDAEGNQIGSVGQRGANPFTVDGLVATLKFATMAGDMPIFQSAFAGNGTYKISIPAGKFLLGADQTPSEAIVLTYTVEEAELNVNVIATPTDGSTVETLEVLHLVYDGYEVAEPDWNNTSEIVVTKDNEPYAVFGNADFSAEGDNYGWNEWDLTLNLTEAGEYTITIPAGKMWDPVTMTAFPELVLTYTVTGAPVGINGVAAEDIVKTEYFGMNGAALNAPAKGINIVKYTLVDGKVVTAKVYVK